MWSVEYRDGHIRSLISEHSFFLDAWHASRRLQLANPELGDFYKIVRRFA